LHELARLLGLFLLWNTLPALAEQGSLRKCREITEPAAKLACYEALPLTLDSPVVASPPSFGKKGSERTETPRVGEVIVASTVGSDFSGWRPNDEIALENGQIWQVVDGSAYAVRPGTRIASVRRGILGSNFLDIDGVALAPRVRRIK
jgi:hypothetical protein